MKTPHILLISSWQTVNIGDIAHTPGMVRLLEHYFPEVKITLYGFTADGVYEMLQKRFPKLNIVELHKDPDLQKRDQLFQECDFLLHGSGPYLVQHPIVKAWSEQTGKPFGVMGISMEQPFFNDDIAALLQEAEFVTFRDTPSLEFAQKKLPQAQHFSFGPDATFASDVQDDASASDSMRRNGLKPKQFVCCIPRYRYCPYWEIRQQPYEKHMDEINQSMVTHDMKPLVKTIEAIITQTDHKVYLVPEDKSQMVLAYQHLYQKLPREIIEKGVVWKSDYWLTSEAQSIYNQSSGLFGLEMHSPIMCVASGIPAIVGRSKEQSTKGYMWEDLGMSEWLFDFDEDITDSYTQTVLNLIQNPEAAKAKATSAQKKAWQHFDRTFAELKNHLYRQG